MEPYRDGCMPLNSQPSPDSSNPISVFMHSPIIHLQVFRCPEPNKGWGLRCMERIPAGTFVACYLGEVLRESDGDTRGMEHGDSYLFSLDKFSGECDDDDREWEPHRDLLENREEVKPYKQGGFGSAEGKEGSPSRISSFSPRKKLGMTAKCSRSRHPGVGGPVGGFPRVDGGTVISPPASKRGRLAFKVEESAIGNASASTEAVGASSLSAGPGADANHAAKSEMEVGVNGSAESKEDTEVRLEWVWCHVNAWTRRMGQECMSNLGTSMQ